MRLPGSSIAYFVFALSLITVMGGGWIVAASSADIVGGWAWSDAFGWLSFNDTNTGSGGSYGVSLDATGAFSGYAWSERVGWVSFAPPGPYPSVPNTPARLDLVTGEASGWVRVLALQTYNNSGWVKLKGPQYGVSLDKSSCVLVGWAWSSELGWVHFLGSQYKVQANPGICGGSSGCGNGAVEAGEQCDDGNASNTDACTNSCLNAVCGDGFVRGGVEQCDDSNTTSGDGCSATCQNEILCVDDCSPAGGPMCTSSTAWSECGDFDADACLDLRSGSCSPGDACSGGVCSSAGDFTITSDFSIITMIQPFPNPGFIFSSPIKFRTTPTAPFASNLRFSVDAPIRNVDGSTGTGITTGFGTDFNTESTITSANYNDPNFRLSFRTRITFDTVPGRYILKIRAHDEDDVIADKVMDIKLDVVNPTPQR